MITSVLIDNRVSCDFLVNGSVDNVIYCSKVDESLYDINNFITKGGEFIHQYVTESTGDRYVITSITLPSGEILENVKFKVVVSNETDLPLSTIRYSLDDTVKNLILENAPSDEYILNEETCLWVQAIDEKKGIFNLFKS